MTSQPAERRVYRRRTAYETGTIVPDDGGTAIECVIKNISEEGAKLRCEPNVGFPDRFKLCLSDGTELPCEVTWRTEETIGVRFAHLPKRPD